MTRISKLQLVDVRVQNMQANNINEYRIGVFQPCVPFLSQTTGDSGETFE